MKAKVTNVANVDHAKEARKLNQIDLLTPLEIAEGDKVLNDVCHDGVELSINGSDFEDEEGDNNGPVANNESHGAGIDHVQDQDTLDDSDQVTAQGPEAGEIISSSDDDELPVREENSRKVASKVVKVSRRNDGNRRDDGPLTSKGQGQERFSKFIHLRDDPDFKAFLGEMVDDHIGVKQECH